MRSMTRISGSVAVIMILSVLLVVSIPPTRAGFVLASWDYPDEYGQGIENFELYENSTGSWVQVGGLYNYTDANIFDWETGVSIKIICFAWFNSTLSPATTTEEGKDFQRHNVTVTQLNGSTVFSQQDFTYVDVDDTTDPPQWLYSYEVILDFIPDAGEYYTVTIIYEVYYAE